MIHPTQREHMEGTQEAEEKKRSLCSLGGREKEGLLIMSSHLHLNKVKS